MDKKTEFKSYENIEQTPNELFNFYWLKGEKSESGNFMGFDFMAKRTEHMHN